MKKLVSLLLIFAFLLSLCGCAGQKEIEPAMAEQETAKLKYVFYFIGDGMSYPQIYAAADYLGVLKGTEPKPEYLSFMGFKVTGSAVSANTDSYIPDSASAGTSLASGEKTSSGRLNLDKSGEKSFETIAEKLHEQKNMKIGIISSVPLNHATPAAFYAHQDDRNNHYDIGLELIDSGFEYFAGGALLGENGAKGNLYELARKAGYSVLFTRQETEKADAESGKLIIIEEDRADNGSMPYEIDRTEGTWALADYLRKGIEVLDGENGFFIMCEAGKIDWACEANDAATAIHEVLALSDAVQAALDFAAEHPEETLIIVTGDHETGGMSIGGSKTLYDTSLEVLQNQEISFARYNSDYVPIYKEQNSSFEEVLEEARELFGLDNGENTAITSYERSLLKAAYEKSVRGRDSGLGYERELLEFGYNEPISAAMTRVLASKAGINFTSFYHTGLPVAVYAEGYGAESFAGSYDNTEIYAKLFELLCLE